MKATTLRNMFIFVLLGLVLATYAVTLLSRTAPPAMSWPAPAQAQIAVADAGAVALSVSPGSFKNGVSATTWQYTAGAVSFIGICSGGKYSVDMSFQNMDNWGSPSWDHDCNTPMTGEELKKNMQAWLNGLKDLPGAVLKAANNFIAGL